MKKAFIIHGAYGNPNENWFSWLKIELEKVDYKVIVPTFPTPEDQTLENWRKVFSEYIDELDSETIMIGHSLGCPFILDLIQDSDVKIKAIYLISGFDTLLGHPIDEINKTFVENEFNFEKIKSNCDEIVMFNGDNDKYIKQEISDELAHKLSAEYEVIKDGGHLNATSGFIKFEALLDKIKS